jgi:hypothetical protein
MFVGAKQKRFDRIVSTKFITMIRTITIFALTAILSVGANGQYFESLGNQPQSQNHRPGYSAAGDGTILFPGIERENTLLSGRPVPVIPESMFVVQSENPTPLLRLDSVVLGRDWKEKFVYDNIGRITNQYYMEWDDQFSEWRAYWGMEAFSYRDDGLLEQFSEYYWDFDLGELKDLARHLYEYDGNKHHISTVVMLFDLAMQDWRKLRQYDYEYDENGNMTASYTSGVNHNSGEWENWSKTGYAYNEAGRLDFETEYRWNNEQGEYVPATKREHHYNDHGQQKDRFLYSWRAQQEQWVSTSWHAYAYNEDQLLVSEIMYTRNSDNEPWAPRMKSAFEHDTNGNPVAFEMLEYQSAEWLGEQRTEMVYDQSWQFSDLALPPDYAHFRGQVPTHKMTEFAIRYRQAKQWTSGDVFRLYYSDLAPAEVTFTEDIVMPDLVPYPNPVRDVVNIQLPEAVSEASFELFDMTGRLVISRTVSGHNSISLQEIKSGIYVYRIAGPAYEQTGKLAKE